MLILFGSKTKRKVIGQTKEEWICKHCHNQSKWTLVNDRKWFTLFFIPVFPTSSEKFLICPICGTSVKINKDNSDEIMPLVEVFDKE